MCVVLSNFEINKYEQFTACQINLNNGVYMCDKIEKNEMGWTCGAYG